MSCIATIADRTMFVTPASPSPKPNGTSTVTIVGIVAGALGTIALLVGIGLLVMKKRSASKKKDASEPDLRSRDLRKRQVSRVLWRQTCKGRAVQRNVTLDNKPILSH